ncbi:MAG: RsmE family RNA methyltransferase [Spirochaetia bacterium]|nr:RsmE family RNA methyltransferase [Spirochaetota bacterium]MCX8097186.1 RsmE family RNA methyltransferase [Spirochaetota bacterium]MDW8112641.1 RsmE family RNA methyltransferase [Spirochaetia bacterium]
MKIVFSSEKNRIFGDKITIEDQKDFKHLKKVQRIKIGEEILFYQVEEETQYKAKVVDFGKDSIILRVLSSERLVRSKPEIFIVQALVQKGTFEDELNRLSELGVDYLQPIISRHSQNFGFDDKYMDRLRRISYEGAKTVGNPFPTTVLKPFSITKNLNDFKKFISNFDGKTEFLLLTNRVINNVSFDFLDIIPALKGFERIVICVGSEGGFTDEEEDSIISLGFKPVNLGKRILLRSDTVCVGVSFVLRLLKPNL